MTPTLSEKLLLDAIDDKEQQATKAWEGGKGGLEYIAALTWIRDGIRSGRFSPAPAPSGDGLLEALKGLISGIEAGELFITSNGENPRLSKARAAIANTRQGAGWISVLDQRPERNQRVLFWHKPPAGCGPHGYPAIADEWNDDHHLRYASHWMPIHSPTAPGQEGAGD